MKTSSTSPASPAEAVSGFTVLDEKGRVGLPKEVRQSLGLRAGVVLDMTLLEGMLWLRPAVAPVTSTREEDGGDDPAPSRAVLDEKGRLGVGKAVRQALAIRPGSALAYVLLDDALLLIPQDEQLATLMARAAAALAAAGVTTQDLLDDLPAARSAVMREAYGDAFMDALAREHAALHGDPDRDDRGEGAPRGA